jgi:hypothetical protein
MKKYRQPLLPRAEFLKRIFIAFLLGILVLSLTLMIGVGGFHVLAEQNFLDALLNSIMIMSGVGVEGELSTNGVKIFASFYALLSTFIFFIVLGIIFAPLVHRFLHRFHLDLDKDADPNPDNEK